jgi:general secretion pathway protein J
VSRAPDAMAAGDRLPRRPARAGGFTLVEVLFATVLLAAGLTLAFATLVAATRSAGRGETIAEHSERLRAVEGFLRSRLTGVRPIAFGIDQASALPQRFIGGPDRMRFVADLPNYLGRGGPYLHDFTVEDANGGRRITLGLHMVQAGNVIEETPRPPEVLVENLESVRFRYRGPDGEGGLGEWRERWDTPERVPLLVEVTMRDADGRAWPPLVVWLPLGAGVDTFGDTP